MHTVFYVVGDFVKTTLMGATEREKGIHIYLRANENEKEEEKKYTHVKQKTSPLIEIVVQ